MKQLDFAAVMDVLKRNTPDDIFVSQSEFLEKLLKDAIDDLEKVVEKGAYKEIDLDQGRISKRYNGLIALNKEFVIYYKDEAHQKELAQHIEGWLLPEEPDKYMIVQNLRDLVAQAINLSLQRKDELLGGKTPENDEEIARFIVEVFCAAIQLPFRKRDIRKPESLFSRKNSPDLRGYIFDADVPRPCQWFTGREEELKQLHALLIDNGKVFVHGVPGIGKSELVKEYARRYKKDYTNIIYVDCPKNLKSAITGLVFADDRLSQSEKERFEWHRRFLYTLAEDTLLIVDNFNITAAKDRFLAKLLKYPCRIIFTTRNRYEKYTMLEVVELEESALFDLTGEFFARMEEYREEVEAIITLLHRHTFVVELAARLLEKGLLEPSELLAKLEQVKVTLDVTDKIGARKDGKIKKATYYEHLKSLFLFCELAYEQQDILRGLALIPANGVSVRRFANWLQQRDLNTINDLIEMGLIYPKSDNEIQLHPMLREVVVEELKPSVGNCSALLDHMQMRSLIHGQQYENDKELLQIIENIIATIQKDDIERYLRFLEDAFQLMESYQDVVGMQITIKELSKVLANETVGGPEDRALLLDCRSVVEKNIGKQIRLLKAAIRKISEINFDNALLVSNLYANLGGLYHRANKLKLAIQYMKQGWGVLEEYNLIFSHDGMMQFLNLATLLIDLGDSQTVYDMAQVLTQKLQSKGLELCVDYGMVQQLMGNICVMCDERTLARDHFQKAMKSYECVYADTPALLDAKRQEIGQVLWFDSPKEKKAAIKFGGEALF